MQSLRLINNRCHAKGTTEENGNGWKERVERLQLAISKLLIASHVFVSSLKNPLTLSISKRIKIKVELSLHRMTVFNLQDPNKTTKSSTGKYCQPLDQPETYQ
jgi:hypothetical protein